MLAKRNILLEIGGLFNILLILCHLTSALMSRKNPNLSLHIRLSLYCFVGLDFDGCDCLESVSLYALQGKQLKDIKSKQ
jgi:hypothetical protein